MMSIDDAILHCKARAKVNCSECAKEHEQLAKWLEELKKYRELEEQGKLLKLPCAVGDTVYVIRIDNVAYIIRNKRVWEIVEERFEVRHFDCIGKTVFLTQEEAEAALKGLEG